MPADAIRPAENSWLCTRGTSAQRRSSPAATKDSGQQTAARSTDKGKVNKQGQGRQTMARSPNNGKVNQKRLLRGLVCLQVWIRVGRVCVPKHAPGCGQRMVSRAQSTGGHAGAQTLRPRLSLPPGHRCSMQKVTARARGARRAAPARGRPQTSQSEAKMQVTTWQQGQLAVWRKACSTS